MDSTQRELVDVTDHKVRLEGILRDTKSAMQKVTLEQQIEQKSHAQRTAMLEKVAWAKTGWLRQFFVAQSCLPFFEETIKSDGKLVSGAK